MRRTAAVRSSRRTTRNMALRRLPLRKAVRDLIAISKAAEKAPSADSKKIWNPWSAKELNKLAKELQKKMHQAAAELNFEEAAVAA